MGSYLYPGHRPVRCRAAACRLNDDRHGVCVHDSLCARRPSVGFDRSDSGGLPREGIPLGFALFGGMPGDGRRRGRWVVPLVRAVPCRTPGPSINDRSPGRYPPAEQVVPQFELWRDHLEQAHLSAEQPSPREGPRLPSPDAYPRRSRHPGRPSSQGSRRAVGLTSGRLPADCCIVLPEDARLRTAADFAAVVRDGRRAGTRRLVVHLLPTGQQVPPRAGFVVSAKVGNSVVRHRVTRRLRPLVREQLGTLAPGTAVVVRALPSAATATSAELGLDLRSGLAAAVRKSATGDQQHRSVQSSSVQGRSAEDGGSE